MKTAGPKVIKKPWGVYVYNGTLLPDGLCKVVEEGRDTVHIVYNEGRFADEECWRKGYVRRFDTLDEAIKYFTEHKPSFDIRDRPMTDEDIIQMAKMNFPSYYVGKN